MPFQFQTNIATPHREIREMATLQKIFPTTTTAQPRRRHGGEIGCFSGLTPKTKKSQNFSPQTIFHLKKIFQFLSNNKQNKIQKRRRGESLFGALTPVTRGASGGSLSRARASGTTSSQNQTQFLTSYGVLFVTMCSLHACHSALLFTLPSSQPQQSARAPGTTTRQESLCTTLLFVVSILSSFNSASL